MAYSDVVLADGPAAYWKLDETSGTQAYDSSGNARHGTYAGDAAGHAYAQAASPPLGTSHGVTNSGPNSTGPRIDMGYGAPYSAPAAFTIEAWCAMTAPKDGSTIIGPHDNGYGGYGIVVNGSSAPYKCHLRVADSQFLNGSVSMAGGAWYHVAATYDGATYCLYINGVLDQTAAKTTNPGGSDSNHHFYVAGEAVGWGGPAGYNGLVAQAAFYLTCLSPARILAHYQAGVPAKTATLTDDFNDNSLDAAKWGVYNGGGGATVTETGQTLQVATPGTSGIYAGLFSQTKYDLTGSYAAAQVPSITTLATGRVASLECELDANNVVKMVVDGANLQAQSVVAGGNTSHASVAYGASTQWWRIREAGGTLYFEYSATGAPGSWTVLYSRTPPFALTALTIKLFGGHYSATAAGTATFDNVNLPGPGQIALPASDVSAGTWTDQAGGTTNLYQAVDEPDFNDADYVQSVAGPNGEAVEVALGALTDPVSSAGHLFQLRAYLDAASAPATLTSELRQGASALSTPASWSDTPGTTVLEFDHALSGAQANAITDYSQLRARFTATQTATSANFASFVAAGGYVQTSTNGATITPGLPAGWAAGDIHVLITARKDTANTLNALSGWTQLASLCGNNGTAMRTEVWWRRAVAGDTAPVLTFGTGTTLRQAQIFGFRGCAPTGNPFGQTSGGADANSRQANASSTTCSTAAVSPLTPGNGFVGLFVFNCAAGPTTGSQPPAGWSTFTVNRSGNNGIALGYSTLGNLSPGGSASPSTTMGQAGVNDGLLLMLAGQAGVAATSRFRVTWASLVVPAPPVTLAPGGIATAGAFGTPALTALAPVLAPTGIATAAAFGAAAVAPGAVTAAPTGIATAEALGTATLTQVQSVAPTGIASLEALGTSALTPGPVTVTATGIATAGAFGAAVVTPGALTVTAPGIASAEALGAAVVTAGALTVSPTGIASAGAFGAAVLAPGTAPVAATGIASAEVFGAAALVPAAVTVTAAGIASAQALGAAAVAPGPVTAAPAGIASAGAFGAAVLAPGPVTVALTGIASAQALGVPLLVTGSAVSPAGIPSAEAFGTAAVLPPAQSLVVAGIASAQAFGTGVLTPLAVTLTLTGIASQQALGVPVVALVAVAGLAFKRWNGSAWVATTVKRWSGSAWVPATVKRWNGSGWE